MALTKQAANRKDLNTGLAPMQHRHYATIATIIRQLPGSFFPMQERLAEHFADELRHTNPSFDRERFLAACRQ